MRTVSLLLMLSLLGVCRCKQLLGSNPCTWGPTWWCINETTANSCGTIDHCVEKVWKAAAPPKSPLTDVEFENKKADSDMSAFLQNPVGLLPVGITPRENRSLNQDACDSCKDRVLEIKVLIQNNSTSEGFEKILTQDCVKWFGNENACYQMITQSSEEIFSIIKQSSPEQVCDLVLQCGNLCSECRGEMLAVEKELSQNVTDEEVVQILIQFCSKLGPYSQECKAAVTSRIDVVLDDLLSFLKNGPCTQLGVCDAGAHELIAGTAGSEVECSLCMFVWEYVLHAIAENQTEQEMEDVLKKMCSVLGSKFEGICDNLVESNFDLLIKLILDNESPHAFCTQIKVCNSSKALATLPRQTPSALLCSALASIAQSVFSSDLVVRSLVQIVYMICNLMPDETSIEKCQSFVMLYVAGILQLINAALPFSYLCVALLGEKPQAFSALYEDAVAFHPSLRGAVECSICEVVLDVIRMDIDTNRSVKQIQDDVNRTCQLLPAGYIRNDCESALPLVPIVLDLFAHNIQPEEICHYLLSCPNSTEAVQRIPTPEAVARRASAYQNIDIQCFACKAGIQIAFTFLSNNRTLEDIIAAVNQLCYLVSPNYGCRAYLEELLPPIVQYLQQQLDPAEVCLSLAMCQEEGEVSGRQEGEAVPMEQVEEMGCFLCSALATLLDDYAESYDEDAVVQIATRLCDQLGLLSSQCKAIVEKSLPAIVEKLQDGESPQQLCQSFKLCQVSTGRISLSLLGSRSPEDNDCDSCKDAIASIEQMLATEGEESTREYLMEQCLAAYSSLVCKRAVSELISLVESGKEASQICSRLNLCSNSEVEKFSEYVDCDTCEKYGKMVQDKISYDMSSGDFEEVLLSICNQNQIPNCQVYVRMYYKALYELAVQDKKNYQEICQELSFCSAAHLPQAQHLSLGKNNGLCSECKFVIYLAKEFFSRADEQTIEEKVEYICSLAGSGQYDRCRELLDSFINSAIDIINGDMSASELCQAMEACSSQLPTLQSTHMQLWEQLQHSPSTDCTLCTWISTSLHPSLVEKCSHAAVRVKLSHKCSLLPTHEQPRCTQFLSNDYFISTLRSSPSSHVCQTINVCETAPRAPGGLSLSF